MMFEKIFNLVLWQVGALCYGYNRCRALTPAGVERAVVEGRRAEA